MSDETNREAAQEPNPEVVEDANPQGSVEHGHEEATGTQEPESRQLTPEETDELLAFRNQLQEANITDPKAFYADYTKKSQSAAEAQRQIDELSGWKSQVEAAWTQQQQQQADPAEAAWEKYDETLDPQWRKEALRHERQKMVSEATMNALRGVEVRGAIDESAAIGGLRDPNEISNVFSSMTPAEQVTAAQLIHAQRNGTLRDRLNDTYESRESERLKRQRFDDLLGSGSPGVVPGSLGQRQEDNTIDMGRFLALAPAARKRLYGTDKWDELKTRS